MGSYKVLEKGVKYYETLIEHACNDLKYNWSI